MKVLSMISKEKKNAAQKAPSDVEKILKETYNAEVIHYSRSLISEVKLIIDFILLNFSKEYIVIQAPLIYKSYIYNLLPKRKTIILIHDISGLRNGSEDMLKKELEIFKKFKYVIVHNERMKKFLLKKGIKEENIYKIELFDYLTKKNEHSTFNENDSKKMEIAYAGNLKKDKSPFLYQLDEKKMNFNVSVYGIGQEKIENKNIIYKGSFKPDEPEIISGKLGLVWDGNFDESDEKELFKNYTRYNNPHKLSCYLAIGLPVIVWEKSAVSEIVKKYNIGYTISSIYDINNLDMSTYAEKKRNATELGKKVEEGYFTKRVMNEIII